MALTLVVLSARTTGALAAQADLALTLDAPRLVIGRGEGCDLRLPDPTVSHRHASIRQRGGEHVLYDENSTNGTFMDRVLLPPQTPRVLRSGERIRLGRVWLEVRVEPAVVKGSTAALAKELALALVTRGLEAQGEDAAPRITVVEGPNAGATLVVAEAGRSYGIGRSPSEDLPLDEPTAARRHATVTRRADALVVTDCGAPSGTLLDEQLVRAAAWKPGQVLGIAGTRITFEYPAADALAELERLPDERMADGEVPEPQPVEPAHAEVASGPGAAAAPLASQEPAAAKAPAATPSEPGGWGMLDSVVVLVAVGVIAASIVGAIVLLGR